MATDLLSQRIVDLRPLHRSALSIVDRIVRDLDDEDLDAPTPCEGWTLADLLAHMIGQHFGFAASVSRDGAGPAAFEPVGFALATWRASLETIVDAFAQATPSARRVCVALGPRPLPLATIVGAQLLDTTIHTWDVARSVGCALTMPDDLVDATLVVAETIPQGAYGAEDSPFAHRSAEGTGWHRALRMTGRDPDWHTPRA